MRECPPESVEHVRLADWLTFLGVVWFHPPNGDLRNPRVAKRLQRMGVVAGVPDIIVLDAPPARPDVRLVMVEVKRQRGGSLTKHQRIFHELARERGIMVLVARGCDDGIRQLRELGFGA